MDLGLDGRIAMVCAGSRGLGRAVAVALAREGAQIALCARGAAGIQEAGEAVAAANGTGALGFVADVAVRQDLDAFLEETVREFGRGPDLLIWNGGGPPPGALLDLEPEQLDAAVQQHLIGAMHLIGAVVPGMIGRGFGRVVAITSMTVRNPLRNMALSNSVRAGLTALLKTLSIEVAHQGVTVNTVQPGFTRTERLESLAHDRGIDIGEFARQVPAQRLGSPEELAAVVTFLCSGQAGYVNGASIPVDGGFCQGLQ